VCGGEEGPDAEEEVEEEDGSVILLASMFTIFGISISGCGIATAFGGI